MQTALIICRFLHFWALLTLFGVYLSQDLLLRLSLGRVVTQVLARGMRGLAALALLSAIAWLMLTAASMAGAWGDGLDPDTLLLVLGHTAFGKVWTWHLGLSAALLILVSVPVGRAPLPRLLISILLLATLAPVGHVAMFEGAYGQLIILNQFVHLLAVGAWLGGLYLLLTLMRESVGIDLRTALLRFGTYGCVMVAVIIATGLINVRVMSGTPWPTPAFSGFGLILAIKLSMVLCMLALALFNRVMLHRDTVRLDIVRISIKVECLFGIAALAAVSLLGTLPPMLAD